jgi:hypothetical protein
MRKNEEATTAFPDQTWEPVATEDIAAMLAEAAAVDALFERMRRGPFHCASLVCAFLSPPDKDVKSDPAS